MVEDRNGMVHEINLTQTGKLTLQFSIMVSEKLQNDTANIGYNCFLFSCLTDNAEKETTIISEENSESQSNQQEQADSCKGMLN